MDLAYYVLSPFTWLLQLFNDLTGGYGFALILFAVVVKLILFPFSLKGKKSMIRMNMVSGKMQQIQKKYANDRERQNLEIQKLYEKEKISPMGGCLWSLLPVFILLPLYAIIRQPLKYMMGLTEVEISAVAEALNWAQVSIDNGWVKNIADAASNVYTNAGYNQLFLSSLITPENLSAVQTAVGEASSSIFSINFSFLGLDLSQVPQLKFWEQGLSWDSIGRFLIPIISAGTGLLFSFISMRTNQMNSQQSDQQKSTNRTMMIVTPLMSLWIGFAMPAALGVYWVVNNLLSMLQEFVAGRILKKDYEAAAAARAEQERLEKEEEKKRRREAAERKAQAIAEAKANRGKKKAAAPVEKKRGDSSVIAVSGVGIRAYARGRAYDPYRFRPEGPTPYKDPSEIDEAAVEAALEKKKSRWGRKKKEEPVKEAPDSKALEKEAGELEQTAADAQADEMIVEEILEQKAAQPEGGEAPAAEAPEAPADAGDPWEKIDQEIRDIQQDAEPDKKDS